jgi:hypothetical protein
MRRCVYSSPHDHLSSFFIAVNDNSVRVARLVGRVGSSGLATALPKTEPGVTQCSEWDAVYLIPLARKLSG